MSLSVDIHKRLGDFSLDVAFETNGGVLGLLGASGCGKSMTLKCIAGIQRPDRGRIVLDGRVLFDSDRHIDLPPQRRGVGYLFQSYALFPNMTVRQNILCALRGRKDRRARAEELVGLMQLDGLEEHRPCQLSGGQQQRAALARLLAPEPIVILLDEPFSALDDHLRERVERETRAVLDACGRDAVLVTHSRDEAFRLTRDLVVMEQGRCVERGATQALFHRPRTLAAARLTGCKNFSRLRPLGGCLAEALDWGVVLRGPEPVPPGAAWVGVRAHDFRPAQGPGENHLPVLAEERREDPFEWNILFSPALGAKERIWWKVSKQTGPAQAPYLSVRPEHVLFLEGSEEPRHE